MGGVYAAGTSFGTRVCNNVIFNVDSYTYGEQGLYPDEGSEGIVFENPISSTTPGLGSFHQHYRPRQHRAQQHPRVQPPVPGGDHARRAAPLCRDRGNIIYWAQPDRQQGRRYRGTEKRVLSGGAIVVVR